MRTRFHPSVFSALPSVAMVLGWVAWGSAELPPIPEILLPDPAATGPGAYPNGSISSALFRVVSPPGVMNAGANQDEIQVSVPFAGPIPWTTNRYNEGDVAVQLSPFDVSQANQLLGTSPPWAGSAAEREYKFEEGTQPQTQVWNIHSQVGVVLATPAQNIVTWDDGIADYYPTVALARASSGFGYNMVDGNWARGGIDLNLGSYGAIDEANFSTAVGWFPFAGDWIAGWMGDPDAEGGSRWGGEGTRSPLFDPVDVADVFAWTDLVTAELDSENGADFGGLGTLKLNSVGVSSNRDGMLFTISDDGSSSTNITAASPLADGSGWVYSNREDNQADPLVVAGNDQSSFGFVYIPYDAANLVGGHVDGDNGSTIAKAGNFSIERINTGVYALNLNGQTESDGVLLLSNADMLAGSDVLADRNHLSYQWDSVGSRFLINARHFDGEAVLEDTDFYFAWLDFDNPIRLGTECSSTSRGDLDGNGRVEFADFLVLSSNFGKTVTSHTQGDVDCDGTVAFADFLILSANFGQSAAGATASVPEPSCSLIPLIFAVRYFRGRNRRR